MAKPDRPLNLAVAQVQRPAWPSTLPDFGVEPFAPIADATLLTADEAMRLGLVLADRTTCNLSIERFEQFMAAPAPRTLMIHAIDAEPAVPLLTFWLMRHINAIAAIANHLMHDLECEVLFILPVDLPERVRKALAPLSPARWVDGRYPGGHWRLLPRAARVKAAQSLVIDVVAATDWAEAMTTGAAATRRPIGVHRREQIEYRVINRDSTVASLRDDDSPDAEQWFAGPRLADRQLSDASTIADGELTFYREPRGDRASSICIRCGACIAICPTRVDVVALLRASAHVPHPSKRSAAKLHRAGLDACVECGLCTAVCPSGIELHHAITELKAAHAERTHDE